MPCPTGRRSQFPEDTLLIYVGIHVPNHKNKTEVQLETQSFLTDLLLYIISRVYLEALLLLKGNKIYLDMTFSINNGFRNSF